jgi:hypothetical protein
MNVNREFRPGPCPAQPVPRHCAKAPDRGTACTRALPRVQFETHVSLLAMSRYEHRMATLPCAEDSDDEWIAELLTAPAKSDSDSDSSDWARELMGKEPTDKRRARLACKAARDSASSTASGSERHTPRNPTDRCIVSSLSSVSCSRGVLSGAAVCGDTERLVGKRRVPRTALFGRPSVSAAVESLPVPVALPEPVPCLIRRRSRSQKRHPQRHEAYANRYKAAAELMSACTCRVLQTPEQDEVVHTCLVHFSKQDGATDLLKTQRCIGATFSLGGILH